MNRADYYLQIPEGPYAEELNHLRWSRGFDALELPDGTTFALAGEVATFLKGFASQRPLVHFGFVLHLMLLMRCGRANQARHDFGPLHRAYVQAGRPARMAGVVAARLCERMPAAPDAPTAQEVSDRLTNFWLPGTQTTTVEVPAESTPLSPDVFEAHLIGVLEQYSHADLLHWFRHGQAPPRGGEQLAGALLEQRPRSLHAVLADLSRDERLAEVVPFVETLAGALALPPRQLATQELPLGGYTDVTAHGRPEQILLSQFALDPLEFVRRFAENELLYFRREEPHVRAREQMVVLLDQGVRTWGPVRLVLTAAVLALGRLALRRRLPLLVAATGTAGVITDPLQSERSDLAELLAASDLSANPGLALERVLETDTDAVRDVVLLTHPRNLAEADVSAAARRAGRAARLFALAVDGDGAAELSELRHGIPVSLSRFRVDLNQPKPLPAAPREPMAPWRGDVEPVGFPFRFGVAAKSRQVQAVFDWAGDWLLTGTTSGFLQATSTDGSAAEILPRGMFGGKVVKDLRTALGVAGGFVVIGRIQDSLVAVHYDFPSRTVKTHEFLALTSLGIPELAWFYLRSLHAVAAHGNKSPTVTALSLTTGQVNIPVEMLKILVTEQQAPNGKRGQWLKMPLQETWPQNRCAFRPWPWLEFESETGRITLHGVTPPWQPFLPLADGKPMLKGRSIFAAECQRDTLAATYCTDDRKWVHQLFRGPEGVPGAVYPANRDDLLVRLSTDGRLAAMRPMRRTSEQFGVFDTTDGSAPARCLTPVGRFHNNLDVRLGGCFLSVALGVCGHFVSWDRGSLDHDYGEIIPPTQALHCRTIQALPGRIPGFLNYDDKRFRAAAWNNLIAVVDLFGQVFLFEHTGGLVCAFFAFRRGIAAWMPDGTCWGSSALLGRPETPDGAARIGGALLEAWERGEGTIT